MGVHRIAEANYQMSRESFYPKLSNFKHNMKKQSNFKEQSNSSLWRTSGMEMFVGRYPLNQGEDPIFLIFIKLHF